MELPSTKDERLERRLELQQQSDFDSLHGILPGKHFYQFYKGSDDFLCVMIPYFQTGLEKGEACLWLVSKRNGPHFSRATAEGLIPRFSYYDSSGQLVIHSAEDWYLTDGFFDEAKALDNAGQYLKKMREFGFQRFRVAGDIGGAVPRDDWPKAEIYERKASSWIKSESVIALCSYPILECTPSQTKAILDCHEDVLVGKL